MDRNASSSLAEYVGSTVDWLREAGVDCSFDDEPTSWLKAVETAPKGIEQPKKPVKQPAAPPPPPRVDGSEDNWPTDLVAFGQWWMAEPSLDAGGATPRIPPRGKSGARLMVLIAHPESEDRGELLSGPQGRLFANFLKAANIADDDVYFASGLPRHTPHADWQALSASGFGKIALHHITLAKPERVLLFGQDILALIGNTPAQNASLSLNLNQEGSSIPALAARSLDHMLNIPSARARFWRDWLDWTDG